MNTSALWRPYRQKKSHKNRKTVWEEVYHDRYQSVAGVEVSFPETAVDGAYVKLFRADHRLTQAALANIMGVKKKTIEKWEQGVNKVSGSSAVLLKLLRDDPELIGRLYKVQAVSGKTETDDYTPIDRKVINGTVKTAAKVRRNIWAAVF